MAVVIIIGAGPLLRRSDRTRGVARPLNEFYAVSIPPSGRAHKTLVLSPVFTNRITVSIDGEAGDMGMVPWSGTIGAERSWEHDVDVDGAISNGLGVRSTRSFSWTITHPSQGILWAIIIRVPPSGIPGSRTAFINLTYE